jgi:hypothetical protein
MQKLDPLILRTTMGASDGPLMAQGGFSCSSTDRGSNQRSQLSPFIPTKCEL